MPVPPDTSNSVAAGITCIALLVTMGFLAAVRRFAPARFNTTAGLSIAWLLLWAGLAASGILARFDLRPSPFFGMFAATIVGGFALGMSPLGTTLSRSVPLWGLVLFQAFRLPLELFMSDAAQLGIMPPEMSIEGYNFDFLTGLTALPIAFVLWRGGPQWLATGWSCFGSLCLLTIAILGTASSPMFQAFGPEHVNSWVAYFPYVWLPTVLVLMAIAGHVVVFRRVLRARRTFRTATA